MSIGAGIFLFVVGAILAFAVDGSLGGGAVDLSMIGYILMGGGALVTLISLAFFFKKRTRTTSVATEDSAGHVVERSSVEKSSR
jgi:divalent metal cation (Fe/Co/Zn/Cd) transporter